MCCPNDCVKFPQTHTHTCTYKFLHWQFHLSHTMLKWSILSSEPVKCLRYGYALLPCRFDFFSSISRKKGGFYCNNMLLYIVEIVLTWLNSVCMFCSHSNPLPTGNTRAKDLKSQHLKGILCIFMGQWSRLLWLSCDSFSERRGWHSSVGKTAGGVWLQWAFVGQLQ